MAKLTRDEFISSLKEMNLLEIKELVDAMKEEFGVDPSAVAVAAAPAAQEDPEHRTARKFRSSAAPQSVVRLFAAQLSFVAVLIDKVRIIKL